MKKPSRRSAVDCSAFTLVELLVVIGIIALLISVLLPALRKARMSAERVQCLSNMRQISNAILMFANDNHGTMPSSGGFNCYKVDPVSGAYVQITSATDPQRTSIADWISWERGVDPYTGFVADCAQLNITYSLVARYLGTKEIDTTSPAADNLANPALDAVYRCPADDILNRPNHADNSHGYYRYSYTMNQAWGNPIYAFSGYGTKGNPCPRFDGVFDGRITSIRNSSQKILLICEDPLTLSSACFSPNANGWSGTTPIDLVSARHETNYSKANSYNGTMYTSNGIGNQDARGNVTFCDGHGEFFSRKDALRGKYSGSPVPDPVGF